MHKLSPVLPDKLPLLIPYAGVMPLGRFVVFDDLLFTAGFADGTSIVFIASCWRQLLLSILLHDY